MIIDLEQEKKGGLDESQLARAVMLLMGLSETCDGPLNYACSHCMTCEAYGDQTRRIGVGNRIESIIPHPRVPKPLREVRDELLRFLLNGARSVLIEMLSRKVIEINSSCDGTPHKMIRVWYDALADEPVALALGAVRLLGEKQDGL